MIIVYRIHSFGRRPRLNATLIIGKNEAPKRRTVRIDLETETNQLQYI